MIKMIDKIKKKVSEEYDLSENKGVFLSGFDSSKNLIFSDGVLYTDKKLSQVIQELGYWYYEKNKKKVKFVLVDIVWNIQEINDANTILKLSVKEKWICLISLDWKKSGVMLPEIEGVADAKNALELIKQKYEIQGKVKVYWFTTKRFYVSK